MLIVTKRIGKINTFFNILFQKVNVIKSLIVIISTKKRITSLKNKHCSRNNDKKRKSS